MIGWKTTGNFLSQWYHEKMMMKISCRSSGKSFIEWEQMVPRNIIQHFLHKNFFMFKLLISNQMVFLIQFGINLHLWVFQKAKIALAEAAHTISAFSKNSLVQIKSKFNSKPYDYLYLSYNWENYFFVIGWEQAKLSFILNLHCSHIIPEWSYEGLSNY